MSPNTGPDHELLVAADRWRLWSSLLRGLSHRLANVAQMLALDPPPELALAETRERVAETMAALNALRTPSGSAPLLLAPVLADLDRLQALQMDHPSAPLTVDLAPGLPALAAGPDDLLHVLLAATGALKAAAGERRAELLLTAREDGEGAALRLDERGGALAGTPGDASRALVSRMGGRFLPGPGVALWLPAWRRPGYLG